MSDLLKPIIEATRESLRRRKPDERSLARAAAAAAAARSPFRFTEALRAPGQAIRLIAEIKSASPSAGVILDHPDVGQIAQQYSRGGASAISVVTEPRFFRGSRDWIAQASRASGLPVLMKDFILEPAQIYEGIAGGADAVLLLASLLSAEELRRFLGILDSLDADGLVEVHDEEELDRAVAAGGRIIGVNHRDLRDFSVDLATAERLAPRIPAQAIRVAESGIKTAEDVARLQRAGFDAVLVGESLLRQSDLEDAVRRLLHPLPAVKICGITRFEDALAAAECGASFLGLVFAESSPRRIDPARARAIRDQVPSHVRVAGVFRDQPAELIRDIADAVLLDYIQLHGREPASEIARMNRPVIRAVPVDARVPDCDAFAAADWLLLDAPSPGAGRSFDWSVLERWSRTKRFFLAGGLNPENVAEAIRRVRPDAIDVSSGVEVSPGIKSPAKIRQLFENLVEFGVRPGKST